MTRATSLPINVPRLADDSPVGQLQHEMENNFHISSSPSSGGESGSNNASNPTPTIEELPPMPPPVPPSQTHELSAELQQWVAREGTDDPIRCLRAADAIQRCINRGSKSLNLGECQLSSLPDVVWTQTQLEQLHLGGNRLSYVPRQIGQLTRLTHLTLSDNTLASLPHEIADLPNLKVLDIHKNWVRALPPGLDKLSALTHLYGHGNPLPAYDPVLSRMRADIITTQGPLEPEKEQNDGEFNAIPARPGQIRLPQN